ncbi:MAG: HAD-IIIC family phosphatase [Clostridia bacterium]|nr:HAD-IIIC family phosphatase [Clostridia bacterium]
MLDPINIAILGNSATEYVGGAVQEECKKYGIAASIYNLPYSRYSQEVFDSESMLYKSKPDLAIILLEGRILFPEWYEFKAYEYSPEEKGRLIDSVLEPIKAMIEHLNSNMSGKILINNFKVPYFSPMGILDNKFPMGLKQMIALLNLRLEEWVLNKDNVYVFDYNGLCGYFGSKAEDRKMFYIAKDTMSYSFMKLAAKEYMRYILPLKCRNRKCLVLDLDNTLWGGAASEDGLQGIRLDVSGLGRSFYDFQQEVLNLHNRGVLLAINSRNSYDDAINIIEKHPHMLLRKEHFSALKINWQDKVKNMKEIAEELNLDMDSMVFFDDNPVEREYVKLVLPQVRVVDVPVDSSRYVEALQEIVEFDVLKLKGDSCTGRIPNGASKRKTARRQESREEFLASLETKLTVEKADEAAIPHIEQLVQKSSPFNMTGRKYTVEELEAISRSDKQLVLYCSLIDKFGDSGIVGVCIVRIDDTNARIDNFVLCSKALGRNIEHAFLAAVVDILKEKGIAIVYADYIKTEKNKAAERFYANIGFSKVSITGIKACYRFDTADKINRMGYIDVVKKWETVGG